MTIAVTGATGQLGQLVIAALKKRVPASDILALVRTPSKASALGIAARAFDYNAPDAAALSGVDKLLLISGNEIGQRARQHKAAIEAAKKAGVKYIAYTSLLRADVSPLNLAPEHFETEQVLKASGIAFTILRDGWYTENYTGSIASALAHNAFVGSAEDGRISSAARADYAEAAAVVLTSDGHTGKVYELAGDNAYTLTEFAAELSKQSGKNIPYVNVPEGEYAKILLGAGLPDFFAASIASWDAGAAKGALFDEGHTLSKLIGRPTTPLKDVIAAALK